MHTRLLRHRPMTVIVLAALSAGLNVFGQQEETSTTRLLRSSEADQIAYLNAYIAEGITTPSEDAQILVLSKPSLFVPMLEQKIEEILRSGSPERVFKNPSTDPGRVIKVLAMMIAYRGEELALRQASNLMKIDEDRFGFMVAYSLQSFYGTPKGFQLAYRGLEMGDPVLDRKIMAWVDGQIDNEIAIRELPHHGTTLRLWAEAMVEEYKGSPSEYEWAKDPIVSRLSADRLSPPAGWCQLFCVNDFSL
jgi:hypothetical protein